MRRAARAWWCATGRWPRALVGAVGADRAGSDAACCVAVSNAGCDRGELEARVAEAVGRRAGGRLRGHGRAAPASSRRCAGCGSVPDVRVVTGVNLAMLLDFVFHRELSVDDAAARAVEVGDEGHPVSADDARALPRGRPAGARPGRGRLGAAARGCSGIVLVDDDVAASDWEQDLYRMAVPQGLEVVFATVASAAAPARANGTADARRTAVLAGQRSRRRRSSTARAAGRAPRSTSAAFTTGRAGRSGCPTSTSTDEEHRLLQTLAAEGAEITGQDLPTHAAGPAGGARDDATCSAGDARCCCCAGARWWRSTW